MVMLQKKARAEREKFKHKPGIATSAQQEKGKKAKEWLIVWLLLTAICNKGGIVICIFQKLRTQQRQLCFVPIVEFQTKVKFV